MSENQNFNPLMDFARKVECSVKLPSQGLWYDEDDIVFNQIGEVDIKPMLPNDEMIMANPETLISGESILKIIKSCCEGIKNPENLYYPDINTILLGIRKASYGEKLEQQYICPNCWSKKSDIENAEYIRLTIEKFEGNELTEEDAKQIKEEADKTTKPIIDKMERDNKILITPQVIEIDVNEVLATQTLMPKEEVYETKDGLKIYLSPYKCSDKIKFTTQQIKFQKLAKYFEENQRKMKDEDLIKKEYLDSLENVTNMYFDITDLTLDVITSCIIKIVMPNGIEVDNKQQISEYIKNTPVQIITDLKNKIDKLNEYGIRQFIPCECQCCGHKWDEKFYGFNQSDFFGIGS